MGRLYYDSDGKARLQSGEGDTKTKEYFEKIAKLIPSEIIAAYMAIIGLIPLIKNNSLHEPFYYGTFLVLLILTPLYFIKVADKKKPKTIHVILSSLAFIVWAYCISGATIVPNYFDSAISSIILIVFTLISGLIPLE